MRNTYIALALAGCAIVVVVILASQTAIAPTTSSTPTPPAVTAQATDAPTVPPTAAPAPKTLDTFTGSGIKTTPDFTVPAEWVLNWTYSNCAGGSGNFAIDEYRADGTPVGLLANELGTGSSGSNNQHVDGGSRYLTISSECHWTVTVLG